MSPYENPRGVVMSVRRRWARLFWKSRRRVRRAWDRFRAPWPLDGECFSSHIIGHSCEQCEPTHVHVWKAWPKAPRWIGGGIGVPVRCTVCGARKCDFDNCDSRRHDHTHVEGLALPHIFENKRRATP